MAEMELNPDDQFRNDTGDPVYEGVIPTIVLTILFFISALAAAGYTLQTIGIWLFITILEPIETGERSLATAASLNEASQRARIAILIFAVLWLIRAICEESAPIPLSAIAVGIAALLFGTLFFAHGQTVQIVTHICNPGTTPDQIVANPDAYCRIGDPGDVQWELRSDDRTWNLTPQEDTPGTSRIDTLPRRANISRLFGFVADHDLANGLVLNKEDRMNPEKAMSVGRDHDGTGYWSTIIEFSANSTTVIAYFVEPQEIPVPDVSITFDVFACPDQNMVSFDANTCKPYEFSTWPIWDDSRILAPPTASGFREPIGWWVPPVMTRDGNTTALTHLYARTYRFVHDDSSRRDLPEMDAFTGLIIIPTAEAQSLENDALVRAEPWEKRGVLTVEISADSLEPMRYRVYVLYHDD